MSYISDRILKAAKGEAVDAVPIWCHRQAGRYLKEFREARKRGGDFFTLCRTPALACEVTLQPIERFELDAAIIFSDILVIPQALGMDVQMKEGVGPFFPSPLKDPSEVKTLAHVDVKEKLGYVFDALSTTKAALKGRVPLIGFSGAPWTLMAYMVHGGGAKSYDKARAWLYKNPEESHQLLQLLTDTIVDYLVGQAAAGAQLLEVFDSWAGDLPPALFKKFSLPYLIQIVDRVKAEIKKRDLPYVPMTVFPKGANFALKELNETNYDVISLDWGIDPAEARKLAPSKTLQGNLDPSILYADKKIIEEHVRTMLEGFGTQKYIANLGHGMLPDHPPEGMEAFVNAVHSISREMIAKNKGSQEDGHLAKKARTEDD